MNALLVLGYRFSFSHLKHLWDAHTELKVDCLPQGV